jgi:hypothetical protein
LQTDRALGTLALTVEEMMARFLPYICFILLIISLICMEAQAGCLGPTPDDEGEELFLLLSIYMEDFRSFQVGGNENLNIKSSA